MNARRNAISDRHQDRISKKNGHMVALSTSDVDVNGAGKTYSDAEVIILVTAIMSKTLRSRGTAMYQER